MDMLQNHVSLAQHRRPSDAMARLNQPAKTYQQNHYEELQKQSWLHWFRLPPAGRGWEDPRGRGPLIFSFPLSPPQHHWHYFSPSVLTLSIKQGGRARRREKRRWRVLMPEHGSEVGCRVSGNCRSHAEPRCLHVHQHVPVLTEWGGEYWISLWSGLNL